MTTKLQIVLAVAALILVAAPIAKAGTNCQVIGNQVFCSGDSGNTHCQRIGDQIFCN